MSKSTGATIDFLLSALRDAAAAKRLFRKALSDPSHPQPRVINTDQARLYGAAIPAVKEEGSAARIFVNRISSSTSCSICQPDTPYRIHLGAIPVGIFKVATLPPREMTWGKRTSLPSYSA